MRQVLYFYSIRDITEQYSANRYEDEDEDDDSRASRNDYLMYTLAKSHNFKITTKRFLRHFTPIFQKSR